MIDCPRPLLGFVASSGTGKTTLLKKLIPLLKQHGLRIGMIKHAHHDFDIDIPGKDSYELRKAGADQTLVASSQRWALITETSGQDEADLAELIAQLDLRRLDLILVEGFKHVAYPRIECHRQVAGHDYLFMQDPDIIAVASDQPLTCATSLPVLDLNNPQQISSFILSEILDRPD